MVPRAVAAESIDERHGEKMSHARGSGGLGITRREAMRLGLSSAAGLLLAGRLSAADPAAATPPAPKGKA